MIDTSFEKIVRERYREKCANCGCDEPERLSVAWIVPIGRGGEKVIDNAVLLCKTCELSKDIDKKDNKRPFDLFISRSMHERLQELKNIYTATGMTAVVRYIVQKFLDNPDKFEDLSLYQDGNIPEVRLHVWIDESKYDEFREALRERGMTVAEAIKGLILKFDTDLTEVAR